MKREFKELTFGEITKKLCGRIVQLDIGDKRIKGALEKVTIGRSTKDLEIEHETVNGLHERCIFKLILYPKLPVNFTEFCNRLNNVMVHDFDNEDQLVNHFKCYRSSQASCRTEWIQAHGYDSVSKWATDFFQSWEYRTNGNCLKRKRHPLKRQIK